MPARYESRWKDFLQPHALKWREIIQSLPQSAPKQNLLRLVLEKKDFRFLAELGDKTLQRCKPHEHGHELQ